MAGRITRGLSALEAAGYRLDKLLGAEKPEAHEPDASPQLETEVQSDAPKTGKIESSSAEDLRAQEPVAAKPVGPVNPEGPPEDF